MILPLSVFYSQYQAVFRLIWLHFVLTLPSDKMGTIFQGKTVSNALFMSY